MAALVSTSHLLHHLLRPPPPAPPSLVLSSFIRPLRTTASSTAVFASKCRRRLIHTPLRSNTLFSSPSPFLSRRSFASQSSLSHTLSSSASLSSSREEDEEEDVGDFDEIGDYSDEEEEDIEDFGEYSEEEDEDEEEEDVKIEIEKEDGELGKSTETVVGKDPEAMMRSRREKGKQQISMTVKEKKDLASYANSLGKKLKSQLVGKGGVTENVATSFVDTLEANELLKIKIHRSCPGELDDVVKQLQELTTSVVVSKIGRTVILYRPSVTKMKEEERKKQAQKLYAKKASRPRARPTYVKGGRESSRPSNRGRRGSSRFT